MQLGCFQAFDLKSKCEGLLQCEEGFKIQLEDASRFLYSISGLEFPQFSYQILQRRVNRFGLLVPASQDIFQRQQSTMGIQKSFILVC